MHGCAPNGWSADVTVDFLRSLRRVRADRMEQRPKRSIGGDFRPPLEQAIAPHQLVAGGRQRRAAPSGAARRRANGRADETTVRFIDQHPCPAIGHSELSGSRGDGAGLRDRFQQRDFAGTESERTAPRTAKMKFDVGSHPSLRGRTYA